MSEAVSNLFAIEAGKWEERYQHRLFQDRLDVLDRWLTKIHKKPDSCALDLGCGTFPMETVFKRHNLSAVGLDTSKEMVDLARGLGRNAQHYSGNAIPFDHEAFDCIIMFNVLEFVEKPRQFIGEINRISRPNAAVLLTFTNFGGLFRRTMRAIRRRVTGRPSGEPAYILSKYQHTDIEPMLRDAGFESISIFRYSWPWAYEECFSYLPDFIVELFLRNRFFADCVYVEARQGSAG